jgi:predicted HNH restriction endonuclease
MSARVYKKPEATHIQGLCVKCGVKSQRRNTKTTYKPLCRACDRKRYLRPIVKVKRDLLSSNYRKYKSIFCVLCGFIPVDSCQLDVHHVDHNHHNNDPNNLQTVCANCHRLIHKKVTP